MPSTTSPAWHLLQLSGALDIELACALAETVSVVAWEPNRSFAPVRPRFRQNERDHPCMPNSRLKIRNFPLLRGYTRFPISLLVSSDRPLLDRLIANCEYPERSVLLCTIPYFAGVAEAWPGPVVYWLTDLIAEYESADRAMVARLDRRLCRAATLVCPNSERIAEYLIQDAACDPGKVQILPNAVRAINLLPAPPVDPAPLPPTLQDLPRPVAGIIGNMAGNVDWLAMRRLVELTPQVSWAFIGPTDMIIPDRAHNTAREALLHHPRCRFTGSRPYGELVHFARSFDVAVLPYLRGEPTWSGSSTRFYEHLAACRPIIAFPGVCELLGKTPLLELAASPEAAASMVADLLARHFDDGLAATRWQAAQKETWQTRASVLQSALAERIAPPPVATARRPLVRSRI